MSFCCRLEKYGRYNMSCKLRAVLGDVEQQMALASGSEKGANQRLSSLGRVQTKGMFSDPCKSCISLLQISDGLLLKGIIPKSRN